MSISKTTLTNAITKALDKQDEYNELKYATKAEASKLFKIKGSVATFGDLPISGNQAGDVYNIQTYTTAVDMHGTAVKAGDNVVYVEADSNNAAGWDILGGTIDLSAYATTADLNAAIGDADETITDEEIYAAVAAANPGVTLPEAGGGGGGE